LPSVAAQSGAGSVWQTINNILSGGSASAYVSLASGATSAMLQAKGFAAFQAIPDGATIAGIVVTDRRHTDSGTVIDSTLQLLKAGNPVGTNKASGAAWPTSGAYATYGSAIDLWGTTWSPAEIKDPNFGVQLAAHRTAGGTAKAYANFLEITVYYSPAGVQMAFGPLTITAGPTGLTEDANNIVTCKTTSLTQPAMQPGDTIVIAGASDAGYNGTFIVRSVAIVGGFFTFTYFNPTGGLAASGGGTATCTNVLVIVTSPPGYTAGNSVILSGVDHQPDIFHRPDELHRCRSFGQWHGRAGDQYLTSSGVFSSDRYLPDRDVLLSGRQELLVHQRR